MAIKSVIFDMDGVILDDNQLLIDLHKKTAKNLGLRIPEDKEISSLWGLPWEKIVDILWPSCDFEEFKKEYLRIRESEGITFPSVKNAEDIVKKLKESGIKVGIVTGCRKAWALEELKKAGVNTSLFDTIVTPDDTKFNKPHGEPILQALKKLGVGRDEAIFVGDSLIDYESAKNADVGFIGVLTGASDEEDFRKSGVEYVINSIADLSNVQKEFK